MKAIMQRGIKDYLKNPVFWIGLVFVIIGVYQNLSPYLQIHYFEPGQELQELPFAKLGDADVMDGYIAAPPEKRRELWEEKVCQILVDTFELSAESASAVIEEMKPFDIKEAARYLEENYSYYGAQYEYEYLRYFQGDVLEINQYIKTKLAEHPYSYYFARKFADFAGLYMAFFATVFFSFLFWQDTRKNTYELLHTKPVAAFHYVAGKAAGGMLMAVFVLFILNVVFLVLCSRAADHAGFSVNFLDLLTATILYILPNILMILSVYTVTALLFKNPLPAMPLLFLSIVYSNMGSRNEEGNFGYYIRPLAVMVRFPGKFFDTEISPMAVFNQVFLVLAGTILFLLAMLIWKRRRVYC